MFILSRATYNKFELSKTTARCLKCLSVGVIEKAIPTLALYTTKVELMLSSFSNDVLSIGTFLCRVSTWMGDQY